MTPHFPIYLDYGATTPVDQRVVDAMIPWLREHFGNPASRSHAWGWEAEAAVEKPMGRNPTLGRQQPFRTTRPTALEARLDRLESLDEIRQRGRDIIVVVIEDYDRTGEHRSGRHRRRRRRGGR